VCSEPFELAERRLKFGLFIATSRDTAPRELQSSSSVQK